MTPKAWGHEVWPGMTVEWFGGQESASCCQVCEGRGFVWGQPAGQGLRMVCGWSPCWQAECCRDQQVKCCRDQQGERSCRMSQLFLAGFCTWWDWTRDASPSCKRCRSCWNAWSSLACRRAKKGTLWRCRAGQSKHWRRCPWRDLPQSLYCELSTVSSRAAMNCNQGTRLATIRTEWTWVYYNCATLFSDYVWKNLSSLN